MLSAFENQIFISIWQLEGQMLPNKFDWIMYFASQTHTHTVMPVPSEKQDRFYASDHMQFWPSVKVFYLLTLYNSNVGLFCQIPNTKESVLCAIHSYTYLKKDSCDDYNGQLRIKYFQSTQALGSGHRFSSAFKNSVGSDPKSQPSKVIISEPYFLNSKTFGLSNHCIKYHPNVVLSHHSCQCTSKIN